MKALLFPGQGARGVPEAVRAWRAHPLVEFARECTGLSWAALEAEAGRAFERTEVLQPLLTAVSLAVYESFSLSLRERGETTPTASTTGNESLLSLSLRKRGEGRGEGLVAEPITREGEAVHVAQAAGPSNSSSGPLTRSALAQGEGDAGRSRGGPLAQGDVVLGHSLGELAAVCVAGAFEPRVAVELAAQRGRLMAREAASCPGGLIAVRSRDVAPTLELAAVNAPDEFILGGPEAQLPRGHPRVPVSGAWHTRAMTGALDDFRRALEAAKPQPLSLPLVRNLDGEVTHDVNSLVEQLVAPVQFVASLQRLETLGVDTLVILGPGLVLRGLVRRTLGTRLRVFTTEDASDLQRTIAATRSAP